MTKSEFDTAFRFYIVEYAVQERLAYSTVLEDMYDHYCNCKSNGMTDEEFSQEICENWLEDS